MDFEYFDDITDLIESDETYTPNDLFEALRAVDRGTLHELVDNYFTDVTKGVPDEASDMDLLMENIRTLLLGLVNEDAETRRRFAEEFVRFRDWYWFGERVKAVDPDGDGCLVSVAEALTLHRLELLGEDAYELDFSDVLDYPIEAYDINFGVSRIANEQDHETPHASAESLFTFDDPSAARRSGQPVSLPCEPDDDDAEDYIDDEGWNTLINKKNPVIDGEFSDDGADADVLLQ